MGKAISADIPGRRSSGWPLALAEISMGPKVSMATSLASLRIARKEPGKARSSSG